MRTELQQTVKVPEDDTHDSLAKELYNHVSVDMSRREDMGERVGSFVGQFGASLCRPDFGAVIISCNVIY
jgi:hypothetical protein